MRNTAAAQDARLILQIDGLREEAEMHKARCRWHDDIWPRTSADYLKMEMADGGRQTKWLRQVET
jgi:hypothetical protein